MTKNEIVSIFISKGILSNKGRNAFPHRPYCWRNYFDDEAATIWKSFCKNYRSDAEAWFCLCRNVEPVICPMCNTHKVVFTGITKHGGTGFNLTCEKCNYNALPSKIEKSSKTCRSRSAKRRAEIYAKRRKTCKELYGDEYYMQFGSESFHSNLANKHGDSNYSNHEQARQTCLKRYGYATNLMIPSVHRKSLKRAWSKSARQKRQMTCKRRYGSQCISQSPICQQVAQQTKRNNIHVFELQHDCMLLACAVKKYGQGFKCLGLEYIRYGSHVFIKNSDLPLIERYSSEGTHTNQYTSKKEKALLEFIQSIYDGPIHENDTSVIPNKNHRFFEIDIYLPELKLAIDFNGTYWHSTKFKDSQYHQRKTECAREIGVHYLHVFEDEWDNNHDAICSVIQQCIHREYVNGVKQDDGTYVGNNALPVFGNIEIIQITEPAAKIVGTNTYYDCGSIIYRKM